MTAHDGQNGGLVPCSKCASAEREVANLRSAIWAYFEMVPDRPAQAESLLRSALPDDYRPVGA